MNTENMIEITGCDLSVFIKKVYDLSQPQGLGFIHAKAGPLEDQEVESILRHGCDKIPVDMDYINGRACKMMVIQDDDRIFIQDAWYDHSDDQLCELISSIGI